MYKNKCCESKFNIFEKKGGTIYGDLTIDGTCLINSDLHVKGTVFYSNINIGSLRIENTLMINGPIALKFKTGIEGQYITCDENNLPTWGPILEHGTITLLDTSMAIVFTHCYKSVSIVAMYTSPYINPLTVENCVDESRIMGFTIKGDINSTINWIAIGKI